MVLLRLNVHFKRVHNIFIKLICYYEYDYIIVRESLNNKSEYTAHNSKPLSIDILKKIFTLDLANRSILSLSIYFKKLDLLLYLDSDSLMACFEGLTIENEVYKVLEKITMSAGLFIRK